LAKEVEPIEAAKGKEVAQSEALDNLKDKLTEWVGKRIEWALVVANIVSADGRTEVSFLEQRSAGGKHSGGAGGPDGYHVIVTVLPLRFSPSNKLVQSLRPGDRVRLSGTVEKFEYRPNAMNYNFDVQIGTATISRS
jgi:hypothetical protein